MTSEPARRPYPLRLEIAYPQRLDRVSTLFRLFAVIPIAIVLVLVAGGVSDSGDEGAREVAVGGGGVLVLPALLLIVFRRKYPRWWFDWNLELLRFSTRVVAYLALLTDRYPSTDEAQSVQLEVDYPDVERDLNRWLPPVKWLLAIPHYIVLVFLLLAALVSVIAAWFAILFTARYPRGLFDFVVGVLRWEQRVAAYMGLLVTDRYPPFSVEP